MNNIHPGLILIFGGLLVLVLPEVLRRLSLVAFPAMALVGVLYMNENSNLYYQFTSKIRLSLLNVDDLSKIFVLVFAVISLVGGIYGLKVKGRGEIAASLIYAGSSISVVLAGDWISLVIFWEIMAVSSLCLVWVNPTTNGRKAGFRYLLIHFFGGNLLMMGALLKVTSGQLDITSIAGTNDLAFWLILIGVAVNGAIPPLNGWIADAYPEATISGAVFMGSFTTKVAIYAMIRLLAGSGQWLLWTGVIMAVFGACMALLENDLRRLLAYHIVSQLGMMVAAVGIGGPLGIDGATAHAVNNIIYKGLLFMGAGAVILGTGKRTITELSKIPMLYKKMPVTAATFMIGSLAIAGLPFLNGFASKGIIVAAFHQGGYAIPGILLTLAGVGTLLSITLKINYFVFFQKGTKEGELIEIKKTPLNMKVAMITLSGLCVLLGVFPGILYKMLPFGSVINTFTLDHIMEYIGIFIGGTIAFAACIKIMKPHEGITLDFDWFFRKPGYKLLMETSTYVEETFGAFLAFSHYVAKKGKVVLNNPVGALNAFMAKVYSGENEPPKYMQRRDAPVGDLITSSLLVLVVTFFLVYFILDVR